MTAPSERHTALPGAVRARRAEELLNSLVGVIRARVLMNDDGAIEEIHVLSTSDVSPKQAVRNVESALLAHLDMPVDHRRISVAQAEPGEEPPREPERAAAGERDAPGPDTRRAGRSEGPPSASAPPSYRTRERREPPRSQPAASHGPIDRSLMESPASLLPPHPSERAGSAAEPRFLFVGHQVTSQRSQRVETRVTLEWQGERYEGTAWTPDLPRPRLEAMAEATLRAIEKALDEGGAGDGGRSTLSLEGVRLIEAFDRTYVLVSVHVFEGRRITELAGVVTAGENAEAAAVLATLQATDRRIRWMMGDSPESANPQNVGGFGDPFDIWG